MENQAGSGLKVMGFKSVIRSASCALLCAYSLLTSAADPAERASIQILKELELGKLTAAEILAKDLTQRFPDFRLGHLLYADIQSINQGNNPNSIQLASHSEFTLDNLRSEAALRWQRELYPPPKGSFPSSIAKLSPKHEYVIVNDLGRSRMYIFKNQLGEPQLIADHYIGMGKAGYGKKVEGDLRTPLGVYKITGYIPDNKLPDLYGAGAYPISYPNRWDKLKRRTGHGIWIHGVPEAHYNRPPQSSEGCITLNNQAFQSLKHITEVADIPVINVTNVDWLSNRDWNVRQQELLDAVERWKNDWESLDTNAYLQHYAKHFTSGTKDYSQWVTHKHRVNSHKSFIDVDVSEISIFEYGGEENTIQVNFIQKYKSDNLAGKSRKTQLWQRINDKWKIVYEGDVI